MDRIEYINKGLKRHLEEFNKCYSHLELFGIFIQGSQNYGLDMYTDEYKSDIDTKVIVIPSLEDVVMNRKPISTTHILPNNEHLDIKDIRLYFDSFKKQNINFVEILFACDYIINGKYQDLFDILLMNREQIAHYNTNAALRCMAGMSMEKKKALCHPYPSLIDKIEKYGYDGKQLHHIIRMRCFIEYYIKGESFETCLLNSWKRSGGRVDIEHPENSIRWNYSDMLTKAKLNQYSLEEAIFLAEELDRQTKILKDIGLKEKDEINKDALDTLNKVQYEAIKRKIKEEVLK